MFERSQIPDLADAVLNFLEYQIGCGRASLLGEHYLSQPIGEFLLSHHSGELVSEFSHPSLATEKRGRPRQIDYALFTRDKEELKFAFEAKWAGNSNPQKQGITDDLLRLESIRCVNVGGTIVDGRTVYRYFILAGLKAKVEETLNSGLNKTGTTPRPTFLSGLLPTTPGKHNIDVIGINDAWKPFFKSYYANYGGLVPKTYRSELLSDTKGKETRILIWRISSTAKRATFNPETEQTWDLVAMATND